MASEHAKKAAKDLKRMSERGWVMMDTAEARIQDAIDAAVKEERAAVLKWLRKHRPAARSFSRAIEAGEHLTESGE